jgi:acetyltransferase
MAFVAERADPATAERQIVAVGRLVKSHFADEAEIAVIVSDGFQRRGIGREVVRQLVGFARDEKLERVTATVLFENRPMQKVFEKLGFHLQQSEDPESLEAVLELGTDTSVPEPARA